MHRCLFYFLTAAVMVLGASWPAQAEGEHQRRAATELLVLIGDAKRLENKDISGLHIEGLKHRIGGGLAGLEIFLRLADQEKGVAPRNYKEAIKTLKFTWQNNNLPEFIESLSRLIDQHPFHATGILPPSSVKKELEQAKALHEELCAGCHSDSDLDFERPAYNLFDEAKNLPEKEFAARMVVGVRGDRITGIDNPFTDKQLSALIGYYRSNKPD